MKKMMKYMMTLVLAVTLIACGGSSPSPSEESITITNPIEMNATKADMSEYVWIGETVADYQLITLKEATRFFSEKGTGIIYIGKTHCDWCQRAIPVLNEAAVEYNVPIYYVDTDAPGTEYADYNAMSEYLKETFMLDNNGQPAFFVPEVVGVRDGVITDSHVSLVNGFVIENEASQMNQAQHDELLNIYKEIIRNTAD